MDRSIRYADIKSHLSAIFNEIKNGKGLNYDFDVFWKRSISKGVTRPIIKVIEDMDPVITAEKVNSNLTQKEV